MRKKTGKITSEQKLRIVLEYHLLKHRLRPRRSKHATVEALRRAHGLSREILRRWYVRLLSQADRIYCDHRTDLAPGAAKAKIAELQAEIYDLRQRIDDYRADEPESDWS